MSLLDQLRRLFADAEVSLVGAREDRELAERALVDQDWFRARSAARRMLDRAPRSPIALALLADACEGAGLDAELEQTLVALARVAGASPDVWLRLGRARARVGAPAGEVREALVRALSWDDAEDHDARFSARRARLALADLELAEGSAVRAEGWLAPIGDSSGDVVRRRLASALARRAVADVQRLLTSFTPEVTDAEGQRLVGEAHRLLGDANAAVRSLARAAILGDARSLDGLRAALASAPSLDEGAVRAAEAVAEHAHTTEDPLWRAALSSARGDARSAAGALLDGLGRGATPSTPGDRAAARAVAVRARDAALLTRVADGPLDGILLHALDPAVPPATALDALSSPGGDRGDADALGWADEVTRARVRELLPEGQSAAWDVVLPRLAGHARATADLDALRRLELLATERARPVRLAIVGEFNAGKSTFVNALLGMDVAPTGILPTTAVAHVLKYGPDPIARAFLRGGGARTVPPERLKALLAELGTSVRDVEVEVPFPYLQRVEIVDTPGFNAPDPEHAKTAMDTLVEGPGVDVAVWLFDVGQPMKTSERRVLDAIVARGIVVQVLVNKVDRLPRADVERVLAQLVADAESIGLPSFRPPLAFSARLAVKARTAGDDATLAESGFAAVRSLLEDELPAHAPALKDRGLRRRAHDVVEQLVASIEQARAAEARAAEAREARRAAYLSRAQVLDRAAALDAGAAPTAKDEAADAARRVTRDELRAAFEAFRKERDELLAKDEPSMAAYLDRRLAEMLEQASGRAMARLVDTELLPLGEMALDAGALARGYAATGAASADGHAPGRRARGDVEGGIVRALLQCVAARLRARASIVDESVVSSLPRARELAALATTLAPPPPSRPEQTT